MYLCFFLVPVSSPTDLRLEIIMFGTAVVTAVVMCAVMVQGSFGEKIVALLLGAAPLWWVFRTLHAAATEFMIQAGR